MSLKNQMIFYKSPQQLLIPIIKRGIPQLQQ